MGIASTKYRSEQSEILEKVMRMLPDVTDEKFACAIKSDDFSIHLCAYIERTYDEKEVTKERLPASLDGWRILTIFVPHGYIGIMGLDKSDKS